MTRAAAIAFLRQTLAAGPRAASDLERQANAQGISSRTLDRARREIGVLADRQGGRWRWTLPPSGPTDGSSAVPNATQATPTPPTVAAPRRIEDLRRGDLIEWNGRAWPFLGIGYRDGVPLAYFTCAEAVGGIACQPVWSVRPAPEAKT